MWESSEVIEKLQSCVYCEKCESAITVNLSQDKIAKLRQSDSNVVNITCPCCGFKLTIGHEQAMRLLEKPNG